LKKKREKGEMEYGENKEEGGKRKKERRVTLFCFLVKFY
jgi:hypothetical protein